MARPSARRAIVLTLAMEACFTDDAADPGFAWLVMLSCRPLASYLRATGGLTIPRLALGQ